MIVIKNRPKTIRYIQIFQLPHGPSTSAGRGHRDGKDDGRSSRQSTTGSGKKPASETAAHWKSGRLSAEKEAECKERFFFN